MSGEKDFCDLVGVHLRAYGCGCTHCCILILNVQNTFLVILLPLYWIAENCQKMKKCDLMNENTSGIIYLLAYITSLGS